MLAAMSGMSVTASVGGRYESCSLAYHAMSVLVSIAALLVSLVSVSCT